jgi:hypothetical protein
MAKNQILGKILFQSLFILPGLTKTKRNFLNAPPEEETLPFDFDTALPLAQVCLKVKKQPKLRR